VAGTLASHLNRAAASAAPFRVSPVQSRVKPRPVHAWCSRRSLPALQIFQIPPQPRIGNVESDVRRCAAQRIFDPARDVEANKSYVIPALEILGFQFLLNTLRQRVPG
jgi:hypothetical protein